MRNKALCVHGHFYQPAREDPLTGKIPPEEGAAPYANWNLCILDQCYAPNARLRNFERISFNIGPTLLNWMAMQDPPTAAAIIEQDLENHARFGFGNAMAQPYHHTILPLASRRDKITQVRWGIKDFELRFGHLPQGMWLPETAVDLETLEVLVECGIEFTILAPWQAAAQPLNPTRPYRVELASGKSIVIFFYHQGLSTTVSFNPSATRNAESFLREQVLPLYHDDDHPELLLIASDGELYGHHQRFRDKFLAYLTTDGVKKNQITLTFPGLWMKQYPPRETIQILERTSWSCDHHLLRWSGACACTENAEWKAPLKEALDAIADRIDAVYETVTGGWGLDIWEVRNRYIQVLAGRTSLADLLAEMNGFRLDDEQLRIFDILLTAQVERQRMFTSCGWFFEDYDRIEPRNVTAYAAQAVWLTSLASGEDLTDFAANALKNVVSWRSGLRGDAVFRQHLLRAELFYQGLERSAPQS